MTIAELGKLQPGQKFKCDNRVAVVKWLDYICIEPVVKTYKDGSLDVITLGNKWLHLAYSYDDTGLSEGLSCGHPNHKLDISGYTI